MPYSLTCRRLAAYSTALSVVYQAVTCLAESRTGHARLHWHGHMNMTCTCNMYMSSSLPFISMSCVTAVLLPSLAASPQRAEQTFWRACRASAPVSPQQLSPPAVDGCAACASSPLRRPCAPPVTMGEGGNRIGVCAVQTTSTCNRGTRSWPSGVRSRMIAYALRRRDALEEFDDEL